MLSEDLDKHEGAPEWMVSYADMITILMSFFVVMFSIASGDSSSNGNRTAQQETVIASLEYRFGPKWRPYMAWSLMPGNSLLPGGGKSPGSGGLRTPVPAAPANDPDGTVKPLKNHKPLIFVPSEGDTLAIGGPVMFEPGTAKLAANQDAQIKRIAFGLKGITNPAEIVATASKRPLQRGAAFADRWELGYARCLVVRERLLHESIEPERMRLIVLPSKNAGHPGAAQSEADGAVRVNLCTQPSGTK